MPMLEIARQNKNQEVRIKIAGIGGAGCNALDRTLLDGALRVETVAINTDIQALNGSVAAEKIQLGHDTTRGLGTGGDPDIGFDAAAEADEQIRQTVAGVSLLFLCVGLGGGTGSGAAPLVARLARQQGTMVIAFVTMPFTFEGKRRSKQALDALAQLQNEADVVICFENDRMGEAVSPKAGVHQAFAAADQTISQSLRAVCELFQRPGLLKLGFDELAAALRTGNSRCLFGFGEADGDNRAHDALARALKSPLMDRGRLLEEVSAVLVNIVGGPSMTLSELQMVMEELNRHISDDAKLLLGTSVDPKMGSKMSVSIISSLASQSAHKQVAAVPVSLVAPEPVRAIEVPQPEPLEEPLVVAELPKFQPSPEPAIVAPHPPHKPGYVEAIQDDFLDITAPPQAEPLTLTPALAPEPPQPPVTAPSVPKPKEERQESLTFDKPSKGRFDKSEPTIVDGEDLDLPAFMRRKVKLK